MNNIIFIGIGGSLGAVMRYLIAQGTYYVCGENFPYGTLVVNILGCFIMGFLTSFLLERSMLRQSLLAVVYIGSSLVFSLMAVALGRLSVLPTKNYNREMAVLR